MNNMNKIKKAAKAVGALGLMGCAVMSSPSAMADDAYWYLGGNVGQSRSRIDDQRITAQLPGSVSMSDDNHDTAYKLFGGYQFNKNFAVEGGYFNLGKFGYTATTVPAGSQTGNIKLQGINIDAVGMFPIADKFSVFGRLGYQYAQAKDEFSSTGVVPIPADPNPSQKSGNYEAGVGVQYDFTQSLGMRVEAERYRIDDAVGNNGDINMYSVGLVYRFDKRKPAPVEKVMMPKTEIVVVHAPAPPPEIVFVTKVIFSVDSGTDPLFGFGKTTITPTGKRALDKFAANLKGAHYRDITVVGYTDRIGSSASNMKLSERRANAVKDYLMVSAGIPADKISARGAGESNPLTKPDECKGKIATKKLQACLAPDRRVEVDVTGTRPAK